MPYHYQLESTFKPAGDQAQAIKQLVAGINQGENNQMLLGVTGSGKTYTMAKIIEETARPALILTPNKILAAQLFGEFYNFFPNNSVEYFVSYYDYYQPEAYVPRSDTYIAKESSINEQIDRMRHSATRATIERNDVIIVASVSCIYGIGSLENYSNMTFEIRCEQNIEQEQILRKFVELQYKRNDITLQRGNFRARGDTIELFPAHLEDRAWRISLFGEQVEKIDEFDPLTGETKAVLDKIKIYPNSHYVTPGPTLKQAVDNIKIELTKQLEYLYTENKLLEAQRLKERTEFDLEMMQTTGSCAGIENYSRYLTGRKSGEPPPTLFEYMPQNTLVFVDESHVTIPQLGAMYKGDFQRKSTLSEYGYRLPSCLDNRPLKFEEWNKFRKQTVFVSATPGDWELKQTQGIIVEQIIRPTGLLDPDVEVRPAKNQIEDLIGEAKKFISKNYRILVTTLTKKMAEEITEYLNDEGLKTRYMHSDINTIERIEIIRDLRLGVYDILVGINLLREGLDIPECALVAILDADKEGFLRSQRTLIQTIGRAARNADGTVILYADRITESMKVAINETKRRREKQMQFNQKNNIEPKTIIKKVNDITSKICSADYLNTDQIYNMENNSGKTIKQLRKQMFAAAENMEFEEAAKLRDLIKNINKNQILFGKNEINSNSNPIRRLKTKMGTKRRFAKRRFAKKIIF